MIKIKPPDVSSMCTGFTAVYKFHILAPLQPGQSAGYGGAATTHKQMNEWIWVHFTLGALIIAWCDASHSDCWIRCHGVIGGGPDVLTVHLMRIRMESWGQTGNWHWPNYNEQKAGNTKFTLAAFGLRSSSCRRRVLFIKNLTKWYIGLMK